MNTIDLHKQGAKLNVTVHGTFNLHTRQMIESRTTPEIDILNVNLADCTLIDSEGIIFLHQWMAAGKTLRLVKPPEIMFEILDILEIKDAWNLKQIITN